jgi:hypothetical protein
MENILIEIADNTNITIEGNVNVEVNNAKGDTGARGKAGGRYLATSTDYHPSMPIASIVTFNVETGLSFTPTQWVVIYPSDGSPENYSFGYVDSYDDETGVLRIYITLTDGNPSSSNWIINISGPQGIPGENVYTYFASKGFEGDEDDLYDTLFNTLYTYTFTTGTSFTITSETHLIQEVRSVSIYHPDGNELSVPFSIVDNDVIILSNINLLNHIIKIY